MLGFFLLAKEYELDTIFISNLSVEVTESKLQGLFGSIGIIKVQGFIHTANPSNIKAFAPKFKKYIAKPFNEKCTVCEVVRIGSIIIFHLSKLLESKFFILCNVILMVRMQGKFEIDHFWEWAIAPSHFWRLLSKCPISQTFASCQTDFCLCSVSIHSMPFSGLQMDKKTNSPKIWIYKHPDGTPKVNRTIFNPY